MRLPMRFADRSAAGAASQLEHQIASINDTTLHNLQRDQQTNDLSTAPPIYQPKETVTVISGLAAAQRQAETDQTDID